MTGRSAAGVRAWLRRRTARLGDDRGSLPMALLIIMVGMALAAALLPTLIVQDRATVFDGSRQDNLAAAQAGVDVVVGEIRAASMISNGNSVGNVTALPCVSAASPLTGRVGSVGQATYSAYVSYYVVDPVTNPSATPMVCSAGNGTYDSATGLVIPAYARITSTGTDGATATNGVSAGRTIISTYVFQTTNANVPDGQIRIYPSGSTQWCMDAGSSQPAVGVAITLQACSTSTPISQQQLFYYRSDLTIQLATSITPGFSPNGLCLDTSAGTSGPAIGNTVVLKPCLTLGSPPFSQQWSFNDQGGFTASLSGTKSNGSFSPNASYPYGYCMSVATQSAGQQIALADCNNNTTSSTTEAWLPSPTVGDGAAAPPQLVNYQQFGRCLDITGTDVTANHAQAYPCKQNPQPTAITFNQLFTFDPASGWLYTTTGGVQYCLFSPRTEGGWVRLTKCSTISWVTTLPNWPAGATITAGQLVWSQPGNTTATAYSQRYTFVDSSTDATRCLGISPPPASDPLWSYVTVTTCNGSTAQKWNASPNLGVPALQNTLEVQR